MNDADHIGTIAQLALDAQHRGGRDARRADGAFFTDSDVADRLARRAIGAWLLERVDDALVLERMLAAGGDPIETLVARTDDAATREQIAQLLPSIEVLDPTCGAGSFLVAAWRVLEQLAATFRIDDIAPDQLHGIDRSADAVDACMKTFRIVAPGLAAPRIQRADALAGDVLPTCDIVLGNPPYVRATRADAPPELRTARVPNVSAWIVERALDAARPGARIAFVLPISTSCTDAFVPARVEWDRACDLVLTSHFDTIPSTLFDGVVQRLSIYEARVRDVNDCSPARWHTSRYHRWLRAERETMLASVRHVPLPDEHVAGSIAKIGSDVEARLLRRLFASPPAGRWFADDEQPANRVLYKRRWSYFLLFCDFVPGIWNEDGTPRQPTELKAIDIVPDVYASVLIAAWSSTLFWWYFSVFTDNRNVNRRDLAAFPMPDLDADSAERLAQLGCELMDSLRACAEVRTCTYRSVGTIRNTYFRQAATRPVIDEIDRALARAFDMTDDELDFVLGFEHRFRS